MLAEKCECSIDDNSIGSDHLPIIIDLSMGKVLPTSKPERKWLLNRADWPGLRAQMDNGVHAVRMTDPAEAVKDFTNLMLDGSYGHIPMGFNKKHKPWFTDECCYAIVHRTQCAKKDLRVAANWDAWKNACINARSVVVEAKRTAWRSFLNTLNARTDPSKVWGVIRSLDGRSADNPTGHTLLCRTKELSTPTAKAEAFVKEYARVSRVVSSKDDRVLVKSVKAAMKSECTSCQANHLQCQPFTLGELNSAISKLKTKSKPGEDMISNAIIKQLSPRCKQAFLDIINLCTINSYWPGKWKLGVIMPLIKAGKDPALIPSYRPICLTSCLAKLYERLLRDRTVFHLESSGTICKIPSWVPRSALNGRSSQPYNPTYC